MGSSFKSMNQRGNKPYALMLLLAFGTAILGVMVLHKLREKRIFTLLLNEKHQDLLTLHLLFQREKKINQGARKKMDEMKDRVYFLRTQKLELDRRLLEMESTIASLKDERKVIESTLEDKNKEIKVLTAGVTSSGGDPSQVTALQLKMQLDVQSQKTKLVTSSTTGTDDSGAENRDLRGSSLSFSNSAKSLNLNDNILQRMNEHITNGEVERMKVNGTSMKDGRTKNENENLKRDDIEKEDEETTDVQGSHAREDEQQAIDDGSRRGGVKLEKGNGVGSRVRRKHSKSKRRETAQKRRDELYLSSKTESTPALTNQQQKNERDRHEKAASEEKEVLRSEDQLPPPNKLNQTKDAWSAREETENREPERKPAHVESNGFEDTVHVGERGNIKSVEQNSNRKAKTELLSGDESAKLDDVEKHVRKQIPDEISNRLHDQEGNRKHEKLFSNAQNEDAQETHGEDENDHAQEENESEAEDSEDTETHEPEIDREDIRRFSESDPDDEAEETEF